MQAIVLVELMEFILAQQKAFAYVEVLLKRYVPRDDDPQGFECYFVLSTEAETAVVDAFIVAKKIGVTPSLAYENSIKEAELAIHKIESDPRIVARFPDILTASS